MSSFNISNRYGGGYPQQHSYQNDNRSADSRDVFHWLKSADQNRDGKFTKSEIKNAIQLATKAGAAKSTIEALGTFTEGGRFRTGLGDLNNDGAISIQELRRLSSADGIIHNITPDDFKINQPHLAKDGGNYFNPGGYNPPPRPNPYYGGGQQQGVQQMLGLLLQILIPILSGTAGGYGNGGGYPRY